MEWEARPPKQSGGTGYKGGPKNEQRCLVSQQSRKDGVAHAYTQIDIHTCIAKA